LTMKKLSKLFSKKNKGGHAADPAVVLNATVADAKHANADPVKPATVPSPQSVPTEQPCLVTPSKSPVAPPTTTADNVVSLSNAAEAATKSTTAQQQKPALSVEKGSQEKDTATEKSSVLSKQSKNKAAAESRAEEEENKSKRSNGNSENRDHAGDEDDEDRESVVELDQIISESDDANENESMGCATSEDEDNANTFDEEERSQLSEMMTNTSTFEDQSQGSFEASVAASEAVGDQKKFFHKDIVLHKFGDSGNPSLVIRAMYFVPKPKTPDDIVVRIEASTVSARDCMHRRGIGIDQSRLPFVPGFEIIGTVQTLGDRARDKGLFHEGDRVAGLAVCGGGNSRFISLPSSRLVHIPASIKSTSAVCLINDYLAALQALRRAKKSGSPFTGMKILVTDGFSPIGQAVIKLAGLEGAKVYCTADESKHKYLSTLGATCFQTDPQAWMPAANGTFDVVIDNLCIDGYNSSWFALSPTGTLVCVSPIYSFDENYEGNCAAFGDFSHLQMKWAQMKAKYILTQTYFYDVLKECVDHPDQFKQDLRYLCFLLEKGDLSPKIAEKVALEDVPDAQKLLETGKANGTIVCVPWKEG